MTEPATDTQRAILRTRRPGGFVECEVLSRRWSAQDPDEVLRIMKERHATAC